MFFRVSGVAHLIERSLAAKRQLEMSSTNERSVSFSGHRSSAFIGEILRCENAPQDEFDRLKIQRIFRVTEVWGFCLEIPRPEKASG